MLAGENKIGNKKLGIYFLGGIIGFLMTGLLIYLIFQATGQKNIEESERQKKENNALIAKQINELDELRKEADFVTGSNSKEIKKQIKDMNSFYGKSKSEPLSQEQIRKQLEELDVLQKIR